MPSPTPTSTPDTVYTGIRMTTKTTATATPSTTRGRRRALSSPPTLVTGPERWPALLPDARRRPRGTPDGGGGLQAQAVREAALVLSPELRSRLSIHRRHPVCLAHMADVFVYHLRHVTTIRDCRTTLRALRRFFTVYGILATHGVLVATEAVPCGEGVDDDAGPCAPPRKQRRLLPRGPAPRDATLLPVPDIVLHGTDLPSGPGPRARFADADSHPTTTMTTTTAAADGVTVAKGPAAARSARKRSATQQGADAVRPAACPCAAATTAAAGPMATYRLMYRAGATLVDVSVTLCWAERGVLPCARRLAEAVMRCFRDAVPFAGRVRVSVHHVDDIGLVVAESAGDVVPASAAAACFCRIVPPGARHAPQTPR